jgi:branched-subunit amino acid aminotransferase/4-amino-4-deoxychorismate lyase
MLRAEARSPGEVPAMLVYLDGQYLDAAAARVSLFDGGYLCGDGLFETLRLYRGRPFDLAGHLERLRRELDLLGFRWRPDLAELDHILRELAARNGLADRDARARLSVSRGARPGATLPLDGLDDLEPTISATVSPLPDAVSRWQADGLRAQLMRPVFARGNFPQLKTLNYLPSVLALRFAHAAGFEEALLQDRRGRILEGAASNVFLVKDGRLRTPHPRLGLLPGRTRALVLALARRLGRRVEEEAFALRDLLGADEAFLTGSVKEVTPLVGVDDAVIGDGRPGPVTREIQTRYRQDVEDALAASG